AVTVPAGVIRLRALAGDLLLPVDADLVPPLLDDEAAALARQRGLVFLPDGRALEYTPAQPLPLSALLGVSNLRRHSWETLPEAPPLADRLLEVVLDVPGESPDDVLEAGGAGIGTEAPRPDDASIPAKVAGRTALGLGQGLAWLGNVLGLGSLARLGASL